MSQTYYALVQQDPKGKHWLILPPGNAPVQRAVAAFTRQDAAMRFQSYYPGFSLAQFDRPNFIAFLQSFLDTEIQHVVYNPEQTAVRGAINIKGDLAVIREVVDDFAQQGESPSSS
jgi:hypothetical protein